MGNNQSQNVKMLSSETALEDIKAALTTVINVICFRFCRKKQTDEASNSFQ